MKEVIRLLTNERISQQMDVAGMLGRRDSYGKRFLDEYDKQMKADKLRFIEAIERAIVILTNDNS